MNAITRLVFCGLLAGAIATPALAQEPETGVRGEIERTATTTPQEKRQYATEATSEMEAAVKTLTKLVEAARRDSDGDLLQCLTARLTSIRALAEVSQAAATRLVELLDEGDQIRADHEFRKIAVARTKTQELLAEAERCDESSGAQEGGLRIEVTGGEEFDEGDLEADKSDPFGDLLDPPDSSPYL